ncbi:MAG: peptidoglycan-binding domain-containing protein [Verrucomicrobia bacterium]|nr:peptidoglycan-binding domain-containing protein [Verrucomicrobiota bacterium]
MKSYYRIGLVASFLGSAVLSATAGTNFGVPGVTTVGKGARGSGVAITVPGYGNGYPATVATRATFSRNRNRSSSSGVGFTTGQNIPGVVTVGNGASGSAVAITVPGYGNGYPALIATQANFANDQRRDGRGSDFGRFANDPRRDGGNDGGGSDFCRRNSRRGGNDCNRNNNGGGVTVIYPDNGYGNYNNSNYLGLPPWYRLNYYTPWMSDYENGTAYQNVPSSHASLGYGVPEDNLGATNYRVSDQQTAGYQQAQTDVDFVVGVQRELRRRGFYRGIVNGISDSATRSSIRAFEASAGLPVTGVIGIPLLRTLGFF